MTSAAKKVLEQALALPQEDREDLLHALSTSLEPVELDPAWQAEVDRRLSRIETGSASFRDAQEHLEELQGKYGD